MSRKYIWYRNSMSDCDGEYYPTRNWTLTLDLTCQDIIRVNHPNHHYGVSSDYIHPLSVQLKVFILEGRPTKAVSWYGHITVEGCYMSLFEGSRRCTSVKNVMAQLDAMDLEGMAMQAVKYALQKQKVIWYKVEDDSLVPIFTQVFGYSDHMHTYGSYSELYKTGETWTTGMSHYKRAYCGYTMTGGPDVRESVQHLKVVDFLDAAPASEAHASCQ